MGGRAEKGSGTCAGGEPTRRGGPFPLHVLRLLPLRLVPLPYAGHLLQLPLQEVNDEQLVGLYVKHQV